LGAGFVNANFGKLRQLRKLKSIFSVGHCRLMFNAKARGQIALQKAEQIHFDLAVLKGEVLIPQIWILISAAQHFSSGHASTNPFFLLLNLRLFNLRNLRNLRPISKAELSGCPSDTVLSRRAG